MIADTRRRIRALAVDIAQLTAELPVSGTPERVVDALADAHRALVGALAVCRAHEEHAGAYTGRHRDDTLAGRIASSCRMADVVLDGETYTPRHA